LVNLPTLKVCLNVLHAR
jgi:hypothetical protein